MCFLFEYLSRRVGSVYFHTLLAPFRIFLIFHYLFRHLAMCAYSFNETKILYACLKKMGKDKFEILGDRIVADKHRWWILKKMFFQEPEKIKEKSDAQAFQAPELSFPNRIFFFKHYKLNIQICMNDQKNQSFLSIFLMINHRYIPNLTHFTMFDHLECFQTLKLRGFTLGAVNLLSKFVQAKHIRRDAIRTDANTKRASEWKLFVFSLSDSKFSELVKFQGGDEL